MEVGHKSSGSEDLIIRVTKSNEHEPINNLPTVIRAENIPEILKKNRCSKKAKFLAVVLVIVGLVGLGAAALGAIALAVPPHMLPAWMSSTINTIGHLIGSQWGIVTGAGSGVSLLSLLGLILLTIKSSCKSPVQTNLNKEKGLDKVPDDASNALKSQDDYYWDLLQDGQYLVIDDKEQSESEKTHLVNKEEESDESSDEEEVHNTYTIYYIDSKGTKGKKISVSESVCDDEINMLGLSPINDPFPLYAPVKVDYASVKVESMQDFRGDNLEELFLFEKNKTPDEN